MLRTLAISTFTLHLAAGLLLLNRRSRPLAPFTILLGTGLGLGYCGLRYWRTFPMLPLHLELAALPVGLGIVQLLLRAMGRQNNLARPAREFLLQLAIIALCLLGVLFPKDFYLPFIRSISVWSHLLLLFGITGRTLLLVAMVESIIFLGLEHWRAPRRELVIRNTLSWSRWGFVFLTLAMFSGEIWCYLGWGTPIIWHDPAITTVMALWLYWAGVLHLHYLKAWNNRRQALAILGGGLLILTLGSHPDLGPFRALLPPLRG